MSSFEVSDPILNSPYEEPGEYWYIREGEIPQRRKGRRPAIIYPPQDGRRQSPVGWSVDDGTLRHSKDFSPGYELALVNLIRQRVTAWRNQGYPGVSRTTMELLQWWRRDGRERRLFFAQVEAAETIIFLTEARADLRQGMARRERRKAKSRLHPRLQDDATGQGRLRVAGRREIAPRNPAGETGRLPKQRRANEYDSRQLQGRP